GLVALAASAWLGQAWLATGFDPDGARRLGPRSPPPDALLLLLVAVTAIAALTAVGVLLVSALFVVPAATARLLTRSLRALQAGAILLVAAEGAAGLWLSVRINAPPGATIALVAGVVFGAAAALRAVVPLIVASPPVFRGRWGAPVLVSASGHSPGPPPGGGRSGGTRDRPRSPPRPAPGRPRAGTAPPGPPSGRSWCRADDGGGRPAPPTAHSAHCQ